MIKERKVRTEAECKREEWRLIQTAANIFLKRGLKREQEVRDQLRRQAKSERKDRDQKWWTQYSSPQELEREKRAAKHSRDAIT